MDIPNDLVVELLRAARDSNDHPVLDEHGDCYVAWVRLLSATRDIHAHLFDEYNDFLALLSRTWD
jgi:hypothetical protein